MSLQDMQENIAHVVHVMFENRGFDTLLGWLYGPDNAPQVHIPALRPGEQQFYGVPQDGQNNPIYWLPDDPSFYDPAPYQGNRKFIHRGNWGLCYMPPADPGEAWDDVTRQIYGPNEDMSIPREKMMRGFYLDYAAQGVGAGSNDDILATSTIDDLPVINTLALNFAVSDMWFCSAPTQTNPNRAFSLGGSSQGRINNLSFNGVPYSTLRTIFGVLGDTGNPWKLYADYQWINNLYFTQYMFPLGMGSGSFGDIDAFANDVAADSLPAFSYIEPIFATESWLHPLGTDYHPPGSLYEGESFLARIYNILAGNPAVFRKTLLIVTFDEHGGTFDHVPPPPAIDPVNLDPPFPFGRYGVRVPTLLISPCVPAGCVFRADYYPEEVQPQALPYDHTSVLATLMKWLRIPYTVPTDRGWLGRRTAGAPTFEGVIGSPANPNTPTVTPYDCSDTATASPNGSKLPDFAVRQLITRITDFKPGSPEHDALAAQVQSAVTDEEKGKVLQNIRDEYGDRRRDGVRSR
jgi:phospholipase C